ncbi:MAG: SHOCT domain-containing protein [Lachnospiraceae bacterium]|nr:SHOCT domain-containing protein [Lachnospiraceae bacterium]
MGLFTRKDPCAICGGKVKGLLSWKIDGQYVCDDCYGTVDLPNNATNYMTIEDFRGYIAFRDENKQLKEQFQITQEVDFGWFDTKFMFDTTNRLLCMDKNLSKTIFEGKHIASFVIKEDSSPLFEGSASGLRRYISSVPDRVMALAPQINQIVMQEQMQRDTERLLDRLDDGKLNNSTGTYTRNINIPKPFQQFYVELRFNHPYWDIFTADMDAPSFNTNTPDVNDYLHDYNQSSMIMEQLAEALMEIAFPGAPEQVVNPVGSAAVSSEESASAAAVDTVTEIQRFKALMDQGIITEEEFTAKKRQLLGI